MSTRKLFAVIRVGAAIAAMTSMIPMLAEAASGPKPSISALSVSANPSSGGTLSYQFTTINSPAGSLVATATVSGKGWKASFPALTVNVVAGTNLVNSAPTATVVIPTNFVGSATLKVTAKVGSTSVGKGSVAFNVVATPPPAPVTVSTNLYDVGFANTITLPGAFVPSADMGAVTYSWTQTGGNAVTLSAANVVAPTFVTDPLTNIIALGTSLFINDVDDQGFTNSLYVTPEHRFGQVRGVAMDNAESTLGTYSFRLLVKNSSITRTGVVTVACAKQTPAHPNIPLGVPAFIKGGVNSTNWTLLSKPVGSTATLAHANDLIAELRPDVTGIYVVKDNVTGATVTNTAATYAGIQNCSTCHTAGGLAIGQTDVWGQPIGDVVTTWGQTLHASMAQRGVDGVLGAHYSEACFQCHTVGFDQAPAAAANGNFWAVQQTTGWQFPAVLQPGNYAAMPAALKNVANIQCESCHGPGSQHPGKQSVSMDVAVCSQCHEDGSHHVHPEEWAISPHAGAYDNISLNEGTRSPCSRCHSAAGFANEAKRLDAGEPIYSINAGTMTNNVANVSVTGPLSCQGCHDPHDNHNDPTRHHLRVVDSVTLGDPSFTNTIPVDASVTDVQELLSNNPAARTNSVTLTGIGKIASCVICHNARRHALNVQTTGANAGKLYYQTSSPHDSPIAESFFGIGVVDYGTEMGNSYHTYLAECESCHMYTLRAPNGTNALDSVNVGGVVKPVDAATYSQLETSLGAHTFNMTYFDGTNTIENIAACNQCHQNFEPVSSFDFKSAAARDYDGNGKIDGIQTEIGTGSVSDINPTNGLLNIAIAKMVQTGCTVTTNQFGYVNGFANYSANPALSDAQHKAAWNIIIVRRDGSRGVHNTQFTVRLLQTTYSDLSTNAAGGTFQAEHPDAYLR